MNSSAASAVSSIEDVVLKPGQHVMAIMDHTGDSKHLWSKDNPDEVEGARALFNKMVKEKKYTAFHVKGKNGEPGEQMHEFDPNAERVIFTKPLAGG